VTSRTPLTFSTDCRLCPRLVAFLRDSNEKFPEYFSIPVPSFGPSNPQLLNVGLAPGLHGANRTGRPFTGDHAGLLLYRTLHRYGFGSAAESVASDDGLQLIGCRITNAVRCVPPENKPTAAEINTCRKFLTATIERFENLRAIVTLGKIAHESTVRAFQARVAQHPFKHGAATKMDGISIVSSYHCSRYNTNTGVLTPEMFEQVFETVGALLDR